MISHNNNSGVLKRFFRKTQLIVVAFILTCAASNLKAQTPYEVWNWEDLAYINTMLQEAGQTEWTSYGQKAVLMQNLGIPGQPATYGDGSGCTTHTGDATKGWYGYQGYTGSEIAFDPAVTIIACGWDATEGWIPIGDYFNLFSSTFDGQGFEISGLWINRPTATYQGLFGYASGATIQDIGVNISAKGIFFGTDYVGGVAGYADNSTITNCYTTGDVTGSNWYVGGVSGYADNSTITDCYATGDVTGSYRVGGVSGQASSSTITNCYAAGAVTGSGNFVGGVSGYASSSTITNCYTTGDVTGSGSDAGGVSGYAYDSKISGSYATGDVTGYRYVGGVAGYADNSKISGSYALGCKVTGTSDVRRVAGYISSTSTLTNNYALESMEVNGSTITTGTATNTHGADISAAGGLAAALAALGVTLQIPCGDGISNVQADFSCPGQVSVTYNLDTNQPTDVILYYSHNQKDWLVAQTVTGDLTAQTTGTGKTIVWDNVADNVRLGRFYLKVEVPAEPEPECVMINGVCWATRNVDTPGTFAANPEDAGMLYQWNRKIAWPATGAVTGWDATVPAGTEWEAANDPSPEGYRVPTFAEIQSLLNTTYVTNEWTTVNGVKGMKFTEVATGNSLFLPATGYRHDKVGTLGNSGLEGNYWSSTQGGGSNNAGYLDFGSNNADLYYHNYRGGFGVRSVVE